MATVKNIKGKDVEVKVGDWVGFKSDFEQFGQITKIERNNWGSWNLYLHNENGFGGDYLRYAKNTMELSTDCWLEGEE